MISLTALVLLAAHPIAAQITSAPEEQMAQRLAAAVAKQLEKDGRFVPVHQADPRAMTIALPARLGWERRLGWTEISYQARLSLPDGRTEVVDGRCWNWALSVCAKQIMDAAAQFAGR